ncbi:AprI/Inh family metalloprotease inhibitor [Pelagibacterium sp. H642]|uniref:AprI/Inh family metalloprotease inhibitor n=1 Tax=Pelagibacterium sp. H642 TaxID=1881069 RepID=UPI002816407B|nr:AprI/Inh family metalloprotease inhibitor [Pelagibacterium sp. H642]WMT88989.1 protease inhibitor Inh/omp19 family protein [Pelagibacterium sp. H642]
MTGTLQRPLGLVLAAVSLAALAACSPSNFGRSAPSTPTPTPPQPAPIQPVQTGNVQTTDLPPIAGTSTIETTPTPSTVPGNTAALDTGTTPASGPGFVLDDVGAPGNTTAGRDLSGPTTMEQLLGGWTILVGAEQCRLNLTYTAKGATGRYRASTPACTEPTLATVTAWQLLGNQIQLYNEADELIGTLLKSGNRFVGTLSGGQAISLVG